MSKSYPVSFDDIQNAHHRIKHLIHKTPVLTCNSIDERVGLNVYFKCELFQKTGSFKVRGACNAIKCYQEISKESIRFSTHSSGNHAQALAYAAKNLNCEAHIVMPENAPTCKRSAVEGYGAVVYTSQSNQVAREEKATQVTQETNSIFVHPFDNKFVIAGQGTIAIEFLEQIPHLDAIIVPLGGGGMCSGITIAAKSINPRIKIIAAEPKGASDAYVSRSLGYCIQPGDPHFVPPNTIADGLRMTISQTTWCVIRDLVDDIIIVDEDEIKNALRLVWERMKCLIEPSAAVGVAAALSDRFNSVNYQHVGIILCGGNVDLEQIPSLLTKQ